MWVNVSFVLMMKTKLRKHESSGIKQELQNRLSNGEEQVRKTRKAGLREEG
jgi:hypothetical protein